MRTLIVVFECYYNFLLRSLAQMVSYDIAVYNISTVLIMRVTDKLLSVRY